MNHKHKSSPPDLPRSDWPAHANFPSQALLLGSHENFRDISTHLVRESMQAWALSPKQAPRADLASLFRRWKRGMKSHEGYEEGKLYPYLNAKYGVSMAVLKVHHRTLGQVEEGVYAAEREGNALKFAHALKKHDEVLVPHLAQEEEMVIPLLLALSPKEFSRYSRGHISGLLRELMMEEKEMKDHG